MGECTLFNLVYPKPNGMNSLHPGKKQEGPSAENFIGNDAPVGVQFSIEAFLTNDNGVSAPSHTSNQPLETIGGLS